MQCELLADYNVKSFGAVFEKIYIEHNGQVQYKLNTIIYSLNPTFVPSLSKLGDLSCFTSCLVFLWTQS